MAEPVLIIPGPMADARAFAPQVAALSRAVPVQVALPLGSDKVAEIAARMLETAPQKFSVVGQSLGAVVAIEMARLEPQRVARLVLMNCSVQPELPTTIARQENLIVNARTGGLVQATEEVTGIRDLPMSELRARLSDLYGRMALALGPETFVTQLRAAQRRPDQQKSVRAIRAPILAIGGGADQVMPARRQEFIATVAPNARLQILPDTGHLPQLQMPDLVNGLLSDFLLAE